MQRIHSTLRMSLEVEREMITMTAIDAAACYIEDVADGRCQPGAIVSALPTHLGFAHFAIVKRKVTTMRLWMFVGGKMVD